MSDNGASHSLDSSSSLESDSFLKPNLAVVETAGSLLAIARRQKDLSVQQVAEQLKLSTRQIAAIESNQFDLLPQMVIVRGFIRAYSKLLKIDADKVVALLPMPVDNVQLESTFKPALSTPFLESRLSLMGRQDNSHKYLMGAALLAVLAVGFFLLQKFEHVEFVGKLFSSSSAPAEIAAPIDRNQLSVPASIVIADNVSSHALPVSSVALELPVVAKELVPVSVASGVMGGSADKPVAASVVMDKSVASVALASSDVGNDILRLKFRQDTWIQVKRENGSILTSHLARAGTEEVLDVKEPLSLRIGNAAGVEAVLRGRPMEILPVNGSNVVNLNLK